MPCSAASGAQACWRSTRTVDTLTASRSGRWPSARASASSPSTSRVSRPTSARAASRVAATDPDDASSRFSSRSRSAVSGVRSWWLASATNRRCEATSSSSRSAISLNVVARATTSGGPPSVEARPRRSPRPSASARRSRRPSGSATHRLSRWPTAAVTPSMVTAMPPSTRPVRRTRRSTGSSERAARTAPAGSPVDPIGTATTIRPSTSLETDRPARASSSAATKAGSRL